MSIPEMMANWFSVTILPRIRGGVTSAMYIGEMIDAAPTPMPPRILKMTKNASVGAPDVPAALTRKQTEANRSPDFLPSRSLNQPAIPAPKAAPSRTHEEAHPSMAGVMVKCLLM